MLAVKNFAVSNIMKLTAVLMTLVYVPGSIMSAFAADSVGTLVADLIALALNGTMCLGMWYLSFAGSAAGAEIMRIMLKIRRVILWIIVALGALFVIIVSGRLSEIFSFDTREDMIISFVTIGIIIYGVLRVLIELGISKYMQKMMEDIRNRLTREVDYGFEGKLAGWSILGIVVSGVFMLFTVGILVYLMLYVNSYGMLDEFLNEIMSEYNISDWLELIHPVLLTGMYICYLLMARRYRTIVPRETL